MSPTDCAYAQTMSMTASRRAEKATIPSLQGRYESVRQRIEQSAERSGRKGEDIILIAVTKHASFDQIRDLVELGHIDLGENRMQNLVQRAAQVEEYLSRLHQLGPSKKSNVPKSVRWHMIGSLQRNKVRKLLPLVRLIHSIDSMRLAEEIQIAAGRRDEVVEVLVQVNTSSDKKKNGIAPAAALHVIEQIDTMVNIKVRGLMCMAPQAEDPEESRTVFVRCQELFQDISSEGVVDEKFNLLSMGMSSDFEIAIECGSNLVRVGTAIFGMPENTEPELD